MNENEIHCLEILREADKDRYLSVLYAPEEKRGALAAMYAFNVEASRIRELVREALPGEMRLQWWRDLFGGEAHGAIAASPVAAALLEAIEQHMLPLKPFDDYCEARIFDLYNDPVQSRNDLEGYCGETASMLIQLASWILDRSKAQACADAAGHAGVAQAIVGLIRMMPIHRARGQIYVPQEILNAVGLSAETYLTSRDPDELAPVVSAMMALAHEHYQAFLGLQSALPKELIPAYLPLATLPSYMKKIERLQGRAALMIADISPLNRQWRMLRAGFSARL